MAGNVTIEGRFPEPVRVQAIIQEEATVALSRATARAHAEVLSRAARHRRTGHYMRSVTHKVTRAGDLLMGVVGTNVFYAKFLESGTGLYGPLNHWIVPKRAQFLRFPQPGNGGFTLAGRQRSGPGGAGARWIYAKRVRGIRPLRIFSDSALVVQPMVMRDFEAGRERIIARIQEAMA